MYLTCTHVPAFKFVPHDEQYFFSGYKALRSENILQHKLSAHIIKRQTSSRGGRDIFPVVTAWSASTTEKHENWMEWEEVGRWMVWTGAQKTMCHPSVRLLWFSRCSPYRHPFHPSSHSSTAGASLFRTHSVCPHFKVGTSSYLHTWYKRIPSPVAQTHLSLFLFP